MAKEELENLKRLQKELERRTLEEITIKDEGLFDSAGKKVNGYPLGKTTKYIYNQFCSYGLEEDIERRKIFQLLEEKPELANAFANIGRVPVPSKDSTITFSGKWEVIIQYWRIENEE